LAIRVKCAGEIGAGRRQLGGLDGEARPAGRVDDSLLPDDASVVSVVRRCRHCEAGCRDRNARDVGLILRDAFDGQRGMSIGANALGAKSGLPLEQRSLRAARVTPQRSRLQIAQSKRVVHRLPACCRSSRHHQRHHQRELHRRSAFVVHGRRAFL
jgi:hypothetical protein